MPNITTNNGITYLIMVTNFCNFDFQAENVTSGAPAVVTTEVCLGHNCVFYFATRFEGSKIK